MCRQFTAWLCALTLVLGIFGCQPHSGGDVGPGPVKPAHHPPAPPSPSPHPAPAPAPIPAAVKRVKVAQTARTAQSPYSSTVFDLRALPREAQHPQRLRVGVYRLTDKSVQPPRVFEVEVTPSPQSHCATEFQTKIMINVTMHNDDPSDLFLTVVDLNTARPTTVVDGQRVNTGDSIQISIQEDGNGDGKIEWTATDNTKTKTQTETPSANSIVDFNIFGV